MGVTVGAAAACVLIHLIAKVALGALVPDVDYPLHQVVRIPYNERTVIFESRAELKPAFIAPMWIDDQIVTPTSESPSTETSATTTVEPTLRTSTITSAEPTTQTWETSTSAEPTTQTWETSTSTEPTTTELTTPTTAKQTWETSTATTLKTTWETSAPIDTSGDGPSGDEDMPSNRNVAYLDFDDMLMPTADSKVRFSVNSAYPVYPSEGNEWRAELDTSASISAGDYRVLTAQGEEIQTLELVVVGKRVILFEKDTLEIDMETTDEIISASWYKNDSQLDTVEYVSGVPFPGTYYVVSGYTTQKMFISEVDSNVEGTYTFVTRLNTGRTYAYETEVAIKTKFIVIAHFIYPNELVCVVPFLPENDKVTGHILVDDRFYGEHHVGYGPAFAFNDFLFDDIQPKSMFSAKIECVFSTDYFTSSSAIYPFGEEPTTPQPTTTTTTSTTCGPDSGPNHDDDHTNMISLWDILTIVVIVMLILAGIAAIGGCIAGFVYLYIEYQRMKRDTQIITPPTFTYANPGFGRGPPGTAVSMSEVMIDRL